MLTAVSIIPSAPVLVPELAGAAAAELAELRDAVAAAVAALPARWLVVGVGAGVDAAGQRVSAGSAGTFAGYGVDVRVGLSEGAADFGELPLCALIAGWVRGRWRPGARAEVYCLSGDQDNEAAVQAGRRLRAEIDATADPIGVLIVADGLHTLTPSAPGGHDPDSAAVQQDLDDALAGGDTAALTRLPVDVVGRSAFAALAGLLEVPGAAVEHYRGAPYGVGYFVGVWQP